MYIRFRGTIVSDKPKRRSKGLQSLTATIDKLTFETTRKVRLALRRFNFIGIEHEIACLKAQ